MWERGAQGQHWLKLKCKRLCPTLIKRSEGPQVVQLDQRRYLHWDRPSQSVRPEVPVKKKRQTSCKAEWRQKKTWPTLNNFDVSWDKLGHTGCPAWSTLILQTGSGPSGNCCRVLCAKKNLKMWERGAQDQHLLKLKCCNAFSNTKYKSSEGPQRLQLDQHRHLRRDRARDFVPRDIPINKNNRPLEKLRERRARPTLIKTKMLQCFVQHQL